MSEPVDPVVVGAGQADLVTCSRQTGLYVVGLNWLHERRSALFTGVGEDAEHVARRLAARA